MASLDDYDEFGNYIGADLDSDDEDEDQQQQFSYGGPSQPQAQTLRPLEGFDDGDEQMADEPGPGALMEVDGMFSLLPPSRFNYPSRIKRISFPTRFRRFIRLEMSTQLLKFRVCDHRTRSQCRHPPRRQTILPFCVRCVWPGCRDSCPRGRHPTPYGTYRSSSQV